MSSTKKYPFYTAYTQLKDLHGIDIPEEMFETMAYVAWQTIGNKELKTYRKLVHPEPSADGDGHTWFAPVPCNAEIIESITTLYEDYKRTSSAENYPGGVSSSIETFIEYGKTDNDQNYQSGKLVRFTQAGDNLFFTEPYKTLSILYKGVFVDEEGLPFLNFKEVEAVATYCAYAEFYKKAKQTKDGGTLQLAQLLK